MKNFKYFLIVALIAFVGNILIASSPLSDIKFYMAYQSNEMVQLAEQQGFLDGKIAHYLNNETVSVDQKAAVINALDWGEKGKNNTDTYKMVLGRKYGKSYENLDITELSGTEAFCLGYMLFMDNNVSNNEALTSLEKASEKMTNSCTVNIFTALAKAQNLLDNKDECNAWKTCNAVRTNTSLTQDLSGEAIRIIFVEMDNYKNSCQ